MKSGPPLAATRESVHTEKKTQHSKKIKKLKKKFIKGNSLFKCYKNEMTLNNRQSWKKILYPEIPNATI